MTLLALTAHPSRQACGLPQDEDFMCSASGELLKRPVKTKAALLHARSHPEEAHCAVSKDEP